MIVAFLMLCVFLASLLVCISLAGVASLVIVGVFARILVPLFILSFLALAVSGCADKTAYLTACDKATFTGPQCQFLYAHRAKALSISGPFNQSLVGINLP